jgi:putative transposase
MKYNPAIHKRGSIRLKGFDYSQAGLYFITICCEKRIWRFGDIQNGEMIFNELGIIAHSEWLKLADRFNNFELDTFQIMPNHMHAIIALTSHPLIVRATLAVAPIEPETATDCDSAANDCDSATADRNSNEPNPEKWNDEIDAGAIPACNDEIDAGAIPACNDEIDAGAIPACNDEIDAGASPAWNDEIDAGASPAWNNEIDAGAIPASTTIFDIIGAYKSLVANECLKIYKSKNKIMGKLWQRNYYEHIIRNERAYHNITNYIINNPMKWQLDRFTKKRP